MLDTRCLIELPCSACAGVYLKTNHNKLSGGLLARAAHPPVLAEAAAAAVLATVAPPPVLLAETAAAAVLAEPAFPPVCSHLPSFAVFFASNNACVAASGSRTPHPHTGAASDSLKHRALNAHGPMPHERTGGE